MCNSLIKAIMAHLQLFDANYLDRIAMSPLYSLSQFKESYFSIDMPFYVNSTIIPHCPYEQINS